MIALQPPVSFFNDWPEGGAAIASDVPVCILDYFNGAAGENDRFANKTR